MVGTIPGETQAPFSWPESSHHDPHRTRDSTASDRTPYVTVEAALDDIAFLEPGWEAHRHQRRASHEYAGERRSGLDILFNHLATRHRAKAVETFERISEGCTVHSIPKEERPRKATMARLARWGISNAVLALPDDLIHYAHNRIPTVREMARLQSFDDDFVFFGKRTSGFIERKVDVPQYTQVGNAVPPLLGKALGRSLVRMFGAPERDLRDTKERRTRHGWIRGSSGFAGYTLDSRAQGQITLFDVCGKALPLPCHDDEPSVRNSAPLVEWKTSPTPKRTQWVPDTRHPMEAL
jgi:DNA (cytosine-5)-methyltransferase 1